MRATADPGSSTEEDYLSDLVDEPDILLNSPFLPTPSASYMVIFLRYPLLLFCSIAVITDLIIYFFCRQYVIVSEYLWSIAGRKRHQLVKDLASAPTYRDWILRAKALDSHTGGDLLKSSIPSSIDAKLLIKLTKRLKKKNGNVRQLMKTLLTSACKDNVGGFENGAIYSSSFYGTNLCVEDFVGQVMDSLDIVAASTEIPSQEKSQFFSSCYDNFGRTAICFSGGGTLAYGHFGVVRALLDDGALPMIVSGSSAGCIAASLIATRTDSELLDILNPDITKHIDCLSDSWFVRLKRLLDTGALMSNEQWLEKLQYFSNGK